MAEYGEPLSEREIEVLVLVATGATNRQIAHRLVVSVNTVKVHLRNVFTKLGVESRTEATLIAIQQGLVEVPVTETETPQVLMLSDEPLPAVDEHRSTEHSQERLLTLPWPKRLALVASLVLVVLISVVTWPRSQTTAGSRSAEWDNPVNGQGNIGIGGDSIGWNALAPMTVARSRFALVVAPDGRLYAIGGETNGGITGSMERYDPLTDQWTPLTASKPTRVSNISAAVLGERIFVPGGLTADREPTAIVEAYSLTDQSWKRVAPLPRPLSSYALSTFDGKLYVFGGKDSQGAINATFIYDPQVDRWREGRAMPTQRAYAAAATIGAYIFVVGGYDGQREQSTCQVYSPNQETWESCEPLILGRGGLGLASVANRLYIVGGGWSNYLGFSEEFDPAHNNRKFFETPVRREWHNFGIASLPHKFYVAGGWNGDYLNGVWEYVVLSHQIFVPFTE